MERSVPAPGSPELRRDLDARGLTIRRPGGGPRGPRDGREFDEAAGAPDPDGSLPAVLKLLDAVRGDLGEKPFAIPYLNPITPLVVNEGTTDKLLDSVERSIPAIYSNYGMAGMTTPLTCAGALAFLNAELLGGLRSRSSRSRGRRHPGSLPMFFDMKTMIDFYDPRPSSSTWLVRR
jgi:hypothetical protein